MDVQKLWTSNFVGKLNHEFQVMVIHLHNSFEYVTSLIEPTNLEHDINFEHLVSKEFKLQNVFRSMKYLNCKVASIQGTKLQLHKVKHSAKMNF